MLALFSLLPPTSCSVVVIFYCCVAWVEWWLWLRVVPEMEVDVFVGT